MTKKFVLFISLIFATTAMFAQHKYIGAEKCKMCHNSSSKGEQYKKWSEAKHSKAYKTLASAEGKKIAAKHSIANPQKDAACLGCHSTAGTLDKGLIASITVEEGVSCESCHGPGSDYKSMSTMKSREKSIENGLIVPDKELCMKCHGENKYHDVPAFDFTKASKATAHPNPSK